MTFVPSVFVMWASYAALPSASVSARSTVPPPVEASAAACTLLVVSACQGRLVTVVAGPPPRWPPRPVSVPTTSNCSFT